MSEREEIAAYVDDLLKATTTGAIKWTNVNPSTFVAVTSGGAAQLLLQRVERPVVVDRKDAAGRVVRTTGKRATHSLNVSSQVRGMNIVITGDDDKLIDEKLSTIYEHAAEKLVQEKLEFLRSTLPKGS